MITTRQRKLIIDYAQKELNNNEINIDNINNTSKTFNGDIIVNYNFQYITINMLDLISWVYEQSKTV